MTLPTLPFSDSFILASGSAIRKQMLEAAGIACTVVKPQVDEERLRQQNAHLPIPQQALLLARAKAEAVAASHPDALVLAADQICELPLSALPSGFSNPEAEPKPLRGTEAIGITTPQGYILCKPENHANAVAQLSAMQGKVHHQHSAACLYRGGEELWSTVETARLTMRPLSADDVDAYLRADEPYQSCGSYMYEKGGKALFEHVEGGADVIQGLPLDALLRALRDKH